MQETTIMFLPATRRVRRKRRATAAASSPPLPGAPVLVGAVYEAASWVRLMFDRPVVGPAVLPGEAVLVQDGPGGALWEGAQVTAVGPTELEVSLMFYDPVGGEAVTLTATAGTGIVAAPPGDGTAWEGVSEVELPFP